MACTTGGKMSQHSTSRRAGAAVHPAGKRDGRINMRLSVCPAWESVYGPADLLDDGVVVLCRPRFHGSEPPTDEPYVAGRWLGTAAELTAGLEGETVGDVKRSLLTRLS
jgi:hypothetical protein